MSNERLLELEAELEAAQTSLNAMRALYDQAKSRRAELLALESLGHEASQQERAARTRAINQAAREAADAAEGWASAVDEVTSLQGRVESARRIIARVPSQPQQSTWNEASASSSSGMHNAKLPELPSFRIAGSKLNFEDPSTFMVEFVDRLWANAIPESRYIGALITCLDHVDREWVREHMLEWNDTSVAKFVANFDEVDQKSSDIRKLQACRQEENETAQKYSDRFDAFRKKLNKSDTDEELIEMFIAGLLPETKKSVDSAMATARCLFGSYEKTLPKLFSLAKSLEPRKGKESESRKEQKKSEEKRCHKCNAPGWTRNHRCKPKQDEKRQEKTPEKSGQPGAT
jgi:hypothetical protein